MGANLFCQKLGYESGTQQKDRENVDEEAFRIGKCNEGDSLTKCTGGCNDYLLGDKCSDNPSYKCTKGQTSLVKISCTGGSNPSSSSCKSKDIYLIFH